MFCHVANVTLYPNVLFKSFKLFFIFVFMKTNVSLEVALLIFTLVVSNYYYNEIILMEYKINVSEKNMKLEFIKT